VVLQLVQVSVPPAARLLWEILAPFPFFQPPLSTPLLLPEYFAALSELAIQLQESRNLWCSNGTF